MEPGLYAKCAQLYNYMNLSDTKYLNKGREAEFTALNGRYLQKSMTVCIRVLHISSACKGSNVS